MIPCRRDLCLSLSLSLFLTLWRGALYCMFQNRFTMYLFIMCANKWHCSVRYERKLHTLCAAQTEKHTHTQKGSESSRRRIVKVMNESTVELCRTVQTAHIIEYHFVFSTKLQ